MIMTSPQAAAQRQRQTEHIKRGMHGGLRNLRDDAMTILIRDGRAPESSALLDFWLATRTTTLRVELLVNSTLGVAAGPTGRTRCCAACSSSVT